MPWKVSWSVVVDGHDVSTKFRPYLISIEVQDQDGQASDTCSLTLDDTNGQCFLPRKGAAVAVGLQGALVFEGTVDEVRSSASRGGGRTLSVSAKGFDARGKVKEPQRFHKDKTTLKNFLGEAANNAGLSSISIDKEFQSITRDHWSADGESFLHLGQRMADELGGTFKIRSKKAVLAKRGKGTTPSGESLPTITAAWGSNLVSWDIAPYIGRPRYTKAKARWFDRKKAKWEKETADVQGAEGDPEATDDVRYHKVDADQSKAVAKAQATEAERQGGEGSCEIDIAPAARAEGSCIVVGARPGVDGLYRITSVTHRADRGGGAMTSLELKQPQGSAGKDSRT